MKVLDLAAAKQKAYRLLSLRPHSEKELEKKLRDKGFPAAVIKEALEKLHDLKYLNDASFAIQWARNLAANKLWGNRKIISQPAGKRRGGPFDRRCHRIGASGTIRRRGDSLLIKKRTAKKKTAAFDIKEKQRIFQSLMGRGFPPGLILNKLGKAAEEEFNGENG